MKIILDACYGSATTCAKKFSKSWCRFNIINNSKNGLKINMNCGSTNLEPLKKALRDSGRYGI